MRSSRRRPRLCEHRARLIPTSQEVFWGGVVAEGELFIYQTGGVVKGWKRTKTDRNRSVFRFRNGWGKSKLDQNLTKLGRFFCWMIFSHGPWRGLICRMRSAECGIRKLQAEPRADNVPNLFQGTFGHDLARFDTGFGMRGEIEEGWSRGECGARYTRVHFCTPGYTKNRIFGGLPGRPG